MEVRDHPDLIKMGKAVLVVIHASNVSKLVTLPENAQMKIPELIEVVLEAVILEIDNIKDKEEMMVVDHHLEEISIEMIHQVIIDLARVMLVAIEIMGRKSER